eukprot:48191-Pyramimonas_sp.AAC.1
MHWGIGSSFFNVVVVIVEHDMMSSFVHDVVRRGSKGIDDIVVLVRYAKPSFGETMRNHELGKNSFFATSTRNSKRTMGWLTMWFTRAPKETF